ncbi:MAG: ribonuclease HII, partial [Acholeplasmataceae bacterium]|nr:ribonuclease HII [Acholeplasmataceae bacterium]
MIEITEKQLIKKGFKYLCGVDEVGRGPLAGPVVAAAVILKNDHKLILKDSKKISRVKRQEILKEIKKSALSIGISFVSPEEIDKINILNATQEAMI